MISGATSEKQAACYVLDSFDPHQGQKLNLSLTECPQPQVLLDISSSTASEETELKQQALR